MGQIPRRSVSASEIYKNAYGNVEGLFGPEHMRALPPVDGQEPELVVTSPGVRPDHPGHAGRV